MSTFEIIRGVEGDSLALDNTRICGPKPWGGGYVIKTFHTDGIYEVVGKGECRKLMAENAELREQGARLFDKTLELGTENAKLRELVGTLRGYLAGDTGPCDCCAMQGTCENHPAPPPCKYELDGEHAPVLGWIDDNLSELGVEV